MDRSGSGRVEGGAEEATRVPMWKRLSCSIASCSHGKRQRSRTGRASVAYRRMNRIKGLARVLASYADNLVWSARMILQECGPVVNLPVHDEPRLRRGAVLLEFLRSDLPRGGCLLEQLLSLRRGHVRSRRGLRRACECGGGGD